ERNNQVLAKVKADKALEANNGHDGTWIAHPGLADTAMAVFNDRRIKCLTCVDDFTKECLTVTVAFGISGVQVTRILDSIALFRG
ncbi:hypothetical protein ONK29_26225, partial [Salmonella enterica subsp. enterica serovar Anatum]|nr:hypothetical protein [Salmonella enterica subsp. enterica serovar Anatum]